jgi:hypothetical protein
MVFFVGVCFTWLLALICNQCLSLPAFVMPFAQQEKV